MKKGIRDERKETRQKTKDKGQETRDKRRGTRDKGQGTRGEREWGQCAKGQGARSKEQRKARKAWPREGMKEKTPTTSKKARSQSVGPMGKLRHPTPCCDSTVSACVRIGSKWNSVVGSGTKPGHSE